MRRRRSPPCSWPSAALRDVAESVTCGRVARWRGRRRPCPGRRGGRDRVPPDTSICSFAREMVLDIWPVGGPGRSVAMSNTVAFGEVRRLRQPDDGGDEEQVHGQLRRRHSRHLAAVKHLATGRGHERPHHLRRPRRSGQHADQLRRLRRTAGLLTGAQRSVRRRRARGPPGAREYSADVGGVTTRSLTVPARRTPRSAVEHVTVGHHGKHGGPSARARRRRTPPPRHRPRAAAPAPGVRFHTTSGTPAPARFRAIGWPTPPARRIPRGFRSPAPPRHRLTRVWSVVGRQRESSPGRAVGLLPPRRSTGDRAQVYAEPASPTARTLAVRVSSVSSTPRWSVRVLPGGRPRRSPGPFPCPLDDGHRLLERGSVQVEVVDLGQRPPEVAHGAGPSPSDAGASGR